MTIQEAKDILKRNGVEFQEVPGGVEWMDDGAVIRDEDWELLKDGGFKWFGSLPPLQSDRDAGNLLTIRMIDPKIAL